MAMRVPKPNVSVKDLVAEIEQAITFEEINVTLKDAATGSLKGILNYNAKYNGDPASSTIDALPSNMAKVVSW